MINVLVTGVGAIIGYGIAQNLPKNCFVVGTDIFDDAVGRYFVDKFIQAPLTSSDKYYDWLTNVIDENNIDIVFPGIEQDVHYIADNFERLSKLKCKFVINDVSLINITKDKFDTYLYLKDEFPNNVIDSVEASEFDFIAKNFGLPFIIKPRKGYASKGIYTVDNIDDFNFYKNKNNYIAQPIVGDNNNEFTVSIFGYGDGNFQPYIALKRKLSQEGATSKAEVYYDELLYGLVVRMCRYIKPIGPTNFQFRFDGINYKLLEINPRISSASSIRSAFGYNEPIMCIDYFLHGKMPFIEKIKKGKALRYIKDFIIYDSDNI